MDNKKLHVINLLPHIYELEDMVAFCNNYSRVYIYGTGHNQEYLLKYFDMCDIKIEGFVVTDLSRDIPDWVYRKMPIKDVFTVMSEEGSGIIVALPDRYYNNVIPRFREKGFTDYFIMSEHNKNAIAGQVRPRLKEEMAFEVSLADHCNLSCQMCDHYSQLSKPNFLNLAQFEKDIARLGELYDHKIGYISLLGGEPTLNKDIIKIIKLTRSQFPDSQLIILTNGVLLNSWETAPEGNLWEALRENKVHITVTVYPINLDYEAIEKKAAEYGVSINMSSNIHAKKSTKNVKISDKHTMKPDKSIDKFYCVNCLYYNKFNVLKNGRIYMCPVAAHSDIFNSAFNQNLELTENDSIDIYKINSWEEIAEFSSRYIPFCSYCDLKHWGRYSEWKASTKKIEEYI